MIWAEVTLGGRDWIAGALLLAVAGVAVAIWSYSRGGPSRWVRTIAALLKGMGVVALALCLVEPLYTGTRPKPGSNLFLVVADNSRSMQLSDQARGQTFAKEIESGLSDESSWLTRLGQDFDVRSYAFDANLRTVKSFADLKFNGESSGLAGTLAALGERYRGQPVSGILLLTDGNATDLAEASPDWKGLPPVYPVVMGPDKIAADLSVPQIAVSQTNFEAAPVTITATLAGVSAASRKAVVRVLDEAGKEVERRTVEGLIEGKPHAERFLLRPERSGISFYTVQASLPGEEQLDEKSGKSQEATLANNRRIAMVDRGGGPYRVLYVGGRPNWEFKFLNRALEEDDEVNLVGLLRVAKKEPKFAFLGRAGERTNPLFRGFGNQGDEQAEQYDEPVLVRLRTEDKEELRGGFPSNAEELFRYHAVIIDGIEAAFFKQDQLSLLQEFVSRRGGGFLMLGGKDSFVEGGYQRVGVGEMLPIYLDRTAATPSAGAFRLLLTREGWLQPWVRLRTNEEDENKRVDAMPEFKTLNRVESVKPGASVLSQVTTEDGTVWPALVVQQFGRGRAAAMMIGDLWRWKMRRPEPTGNDLDKSWRQTVRWLVADVPSQVDAETRRISSGGVQLIEIVVRARDKKFEPLDNAGVTVRVQTPDQHDIEITAESATGAPGEYVASFAPRNPGVYRAQVSVTAPDGSEVGKREVGWSAEPATEEFRTLTANRPLLERIAKETGGEVVTPSQLNWLVGSLPNRKVEITETWTSPLWHRLPVFLFALCCLVGEWGLRRSKGMP